MSAKKINELYSKIKKLDRAYYGESISEVSDQEYDKIYKELIELEEKFPELKIENSPTSRVGDDLTDGFKKVAHKEKMMSIDNTYSPEELRDWIERTTKLSETKNITFSAEMKMDGLACSLHYKNGLFVQAITRGNGTVGDDITANVRTVKTVPLKIDIMGDVEVRGELYMSFSDFENFNKRLASEGKPLMQNPRNTASGTAKSLSPKEVAKRGLSFAAYFLVTKSEKETHREHLDQLSAQGFFVVKHSTIFSKNSEIVDYCLEWEERKSELNYPVDGMVIKVNELHLYENIGSTSKAPRWAIAYKYKAEKAEAEILKIDLQIGRTGAITPVAHLTPIHLAGTTVKKATLHNFDEIDRLNVNVGDIVLVEKSGEIIPKILKVTQRNSSEPFQKPTNCPDCDSELVKLESEVALRCINVSCPSKIFGGINHFVSKKGLDISGCGPAVIQQLLDNDLVKTPADLYFLKREELLKLDRMGLKKADKLLEALENSKKQGLAELIHAIGVPLVGTQTAKIIASQFTSIDKIREATRDELLKLDTVGSEIADAVITFFKTDSVIALLDKLKEAGLSLEDEVKEPTEGSDMLSGKTFVITGTFDNWSRKDAQVFLESFGAKVSSSVSKNTDALVAGEKAGSKLTKAEKLGIDVLGEEYLDSLRLS